jgi:hypothetical protein
MNDISTMKIFINLFVSFFTFLASGTNRRLRVVLRGCRGHGVYSNKDCSKKLDRFKLIKIFYYETIHLFRIVTNDFEILTSIALSSQRENWTKSGL